MFCNKNKINLYDFDGLREVVRSLVKPKRYNHTLGVEQEAVKIAEIFECNGEFIKKVRAAAILHDITKEFGLEKQLEVCEEYNIELSGDDKIAFKPIHAKTGAHIAKIEFGADYLIFDAVYNHTVSRPEKSFDLFNRIIALADWTEPNRSDKDCAEVREYFYSRLNDAQNITEKNSVLDKAMLFSYNKTISMILEDGLFIHKDTVECRNALILKEITV